jgi:hypothetical protein
MVTLYVPGVVDVEALSVTLLENGLGGRPVVYSRDQSPSISFETKLRKTKLKS